jgi:CheY-like chemotaxis protein
MPRAVVERAFEPFFTTKPVGKGTGLGLSMLYGFAKQSGGLAAIKSAPLAGTTIELYLPKARDETPQGVRRNGVSDAAPRGSAVVLVVEDDESVLQTVSELLADLGYGTVGATSGAEALNMLQRRRDIDLVLTDVVMPGGMSGIELAREARRLRTGIKVLLTSGYAEEALAESAAHDEFPLIGKPLRQAALGRALHALLTEG